MNPHGNNQKIDVTKNWITPSERICMLLRKCAELALFEVNEPELLEIIEQMPIWGKKNNMLDDPILVAALQRSNRSGIIHWLNTTISTPDKPVKPSFSTDTIYIVQKIYGLGCSDFFLNLMRLVQNRAWQYWMKIAFQATSDRQELEELLTVSFGSMNNFIDSNFFLIQQTIEQNKIENEQDFFLHRRELIQKILEGSDVNIRKISQKLNYNFETAHYAALIWSEGTGTEISVLEEAISIFSRACQYSEYLKIMINSSFFWVWVPALNPINISYLNNQIRQLNDVKITYATSVNGINGFRRAHLDALTAQRILSHLHSDTRCASFEQIRLVSLISKDLDEMQRFNINILGQLAIAPKKLRQTLLCFLECGCNITETSERLHTHRNTVLRQLTRAQELLPQPLELNRIQVAVALEASKWINK